MGIFAIVNQKGGSAKTTTAVNLCASLAVMKKKVLLIDLDPQGSATKWLGHSNDRKELFNVFTCNESIKINVLNTCIKGFNVIPSSSWLIGVDKALASELGAETILRKSLSKEKSHWDFVFIDCPPSMGILSLNALVVADKVLVPLETRIMALDGLAQLLKTLETVKERLNPKLEMGGILPCRVDKSTRLSLDILEDLKKRFKGKVYKTVIRETVKLAECPSFGVPINIYDKKKPRSRRF